MQFSLWVGFSIKFLKYDYSDFTFSGVSILVGYMFPIVFSPSKFQMHRYQLLHNILSYKLFNQCRYNCSNSRFTQDWLKSPSLVFFVISLIKGLLILLSVPLLLVFSISVLILFLRLAREVY